MLKHLRWFSILYCEVGIPNGEVGCWWLFLLAISVIGSIIILVVSLTFLIVRQGYQLVVEVETSAGIGEFCTQVGA
jgi:hypothetical protein